MKIIVAGDISTHHAKHIKGELAKEALAELSPVLSAADYRIVNQENILAPEGTGFAIAKSGPNLFGLPENIDLLTAGGFDCASLANNHLGDFHFDGVTATLDALDRAGFSRIGGGRNLEEAYASVIFEKDGTSISLIAVCEREGRFRYRYLPRRQRIQSPARPPCP